MVRAAITAGTAQEERDERLSLQPDPGHGAVGDQGGARHVAGVFQHPDQQEEHQDLREEDQDRADPGQCAIEQEVLGHARRKSCVQGGGERRQERFDPVGERSGDSEHRLEDTQNDCEEDQRARHRMEGDAVEPVRPDWRGG
jgi:hypothetical protein